VAEPEERDDERRRNQSPASKVAEGGGQDRVHDRRRADAPQQRLGRVDEQDVAQVARVQVQDGVGGEEKRVDGYAGQDGLSPKIV
jgi:hypothetical protein